MVTPPSSTPIVKDSTQKQTVTPPSYAPIVKDSTQKQAQSKPAATKSLPHTPLIVTVAIVLVVAIVSGIWAIGLSRGSSTENVKSLSELGSVSVGNHFTFGNYPQGSNDEVQPIEWRVLAVEDGKALVISEKLLDCVKYNEEFTAVTWETCTLRQWMNNDFLNEAFSSSEQEKIATVTNHNPDDTYGTSGGNDTQDKIFALRRGAANKYFQNNDDRMAAPTEYAIKNGAWTSNEYSLSTGEKTGCWWLRSPGYFGDNAAYVFDYGNIDLIGNIVNNSKVAVRPAFWLNL